MLGRQIILFNLQLDGRLFFVFFGNCVCIALFINNLFIRRTEQISCSFSNRLYKRKTI